MHLFLMRHQNLIRQSKWQSPICAMRKCCRRFCISQKRADDHYPVYVLQLGLDQEAADLAASLRKIAQVEMHHLNLLGKLITALGGNPIYRSYPYKRPAFWSSGVLQYQCHIEKALHISIAGEQTAVDSYRHLSKLIQDSDVTKVLQRIVLDEEIHIHFFQDYLTTI